MGSAPAKFRARIIEVLELVASPDEQLELQEKAPGACATSEVFYQWDHHYGRGPAHWDHWSESEGRDAFSREEWLALAEFHLVYREIAALLPQPPPRIDQFVKSAESTHLTAAAQRALAALCVR